MQASLPGLFSLAGRRAVITGAASGIGLAIAGTFARQGAVVNIVDCDETAAREAAQRIAASGGTAYALACDVADAASVGEAFQAIFASGRVDILVNNAGIAHVGNLATTSEEDLDRILRVNVKGVYLCMRAVLAHMRERKGGVILNMCSIAAIAGLTDRFAYSTSKGAVLSMTLSVARDYLKDGIRCNAISPARVHTPFVDGFVAKNYPGREAEMMAKLSAAQPVGRMAEPEEVANLAVYLCSDEASFVTGMNYCLDGGYMNLRE
ncbi:MAG TPA: SDR family oxidoreductase [Acidobacteriaceae bacterium]|nr:SDR family oxidoreductase [Acidobacteriaceae bacterium]